MDLIGEGAVWETQDLARATSEPITGADEAIDWDTARAKLLASENRCLAAIEDLTDEKLGEGGFQNPLGGDLTRGGLLNVLAYHQAYHAGQLGLARRISGLEGVLTPPVSKERAMA